MRYVKKIKYTEFNNIIKHYQILKIIPVKDLNWNININDYIDNNKVKVEIIRKNKMIFALVALINDLSQYKVYFFAYIDNKNRLRAYIPKYGNLYNPWTYCHFGNESPFNFSLKSITRMPEQYYEENKELGGYKETEQYKIDFENNKLKEDKQLMINEFLTFFEVEK